jgi:RNA 3'-terminal phosphate cyclase (ATP)
MIARLSDINLSAVIEAGRLDSPGKGSAVFVSSVKRPSYFGFSALGAKGKRAELVADEAVDRLRAFQQSGAQVDRFLADQLLIPLSVVPEVSRFRIERVSQHFETNVGVVKKFLDVGIELEVSEDGSADVSITPAEML